MNDLLLWTLLEQPTTGAETLLPLLRQLAERPRERRLAYFGRLKQWLDHERPELRAAAFTALAGASGSLAFRSLVPGLKDRHEQVRQAALSAFLESCSSDPPRVVHALFHSDVAVRQRALADNWTQELASYAIYLLPDPDLADLILQRLPATVLRADSVPAIFDMLTAGSISLAAGRDILLRMRPQELWEQIVVGRSRNDSDVAAILSSTSVARPDPPTTRPFPDSFDDAIQLFWPTGPQPNTESAASEQLFQSLRSWLTQQELAVRERVACALIVAQGARDELCPEALACTVVAWPQVVFCKWIAPGARRTAALALYDLKPSSRPKLSLAPEKVRELIDFGPSKLSSGNFDLAFVGAVLHLLEEHPLRQFVKWFGMGRIVAAFDERPGESAWLLAVPGDSPSVRRGLVDAVCADRRPRLPKILAALVFHLSADLFDLLDELAPHEITPFFHELRLQLQQRPHQMFSMSRITRLAEVMSHRLRLIYFAHFGKSAAGRSVIGAFIRTWLAGPRCELDLLGREVLQFLARDSDAERITEELARLDAADLLSLIRDFSLLSLLPYGLELRLRELLLAHDSTELRAWASETADAVVTSASVAKVSGPIRQLSIVEQARIADTQAHRLPALVATYLAFPVKGLAVALSRRSGPQLPDRTIAAALLISADPLSEVDTQLHRFLPTNAAELTQLDAELVARCQGQVRVGLGAQLWLYRWEGHLAATWEQLSSAGMINMLRAALTMQTPLLAEHCFRAIADLLAQWRYRKRQMLIEQATPILGQVLLDSLSTPYGPWAAQMLLRFVQAPVDDELLATLRRRVVLLLPDLNAKVRSILNDWVNSSGLSPAGTKRVVGSLPEELLKQIRGCRILDKLAAWVHDSHPRVADEAILRLVELGKSGQEVLAQILGSQTLPAAAITLAATVSLWPEGPPLESIRALALAQVLPPDVQFELCLALTKRKGDATYELAMATVLVECGWSWFTPQHWERLIKQGASEFELALRLVIAPQPHAYTRAATYLVEREPLTNSGLLALEAFLLQGDDRLHSLRLSAARKLFAAGGDVGFPLLLQAETAAEPACPRLLTRADAALACEVVDAALTAGQHIRESLLVELLRHPEVDPAAREAALRHLLMHGQLDNVRTDVLALLRTGPRRDSKLRRTAQAFAWGIRRARELTGRLFSVEMIGGEDLGYTRFEQNKVFVSPLPIFRNEPHGDAIVQALVMHEVGHHLYHRGPEAELVWMKAQDDRIFRLLNLVSDEHLERNLRALDPAFGDPLKRLAAYAFRHSQKEVPAAQLLSALQGRAWHVLTRLKLGAARRRGCVLVESGAVLRELEQSEHSFSRFVRALRMGLGNRHQDPLVAEGLRLFTSDFRHSTMPQLLDISRELPRIFGWQVMMLDLLSQDSLMGADASDLEIDGEGIGDGEVQREVRRILDPQTAKSRARDRGSEVSGLWINVNPAETFTPITTVEPVAFDGEAYRSMAARVRRPAAKMREFFAALGLSFTPVRQRVQGRSFDRSRTAALVLRGEPRVLLARQLVAHTDLFLGVVIDCSGSMHVGDNIEKARRFGALLAEATRGVGGIELRIFGFTDDTIFDAGDATRCAVHGLRAGGGNNDAAGLWHTAQAALRSRRRAKLLVMISDGLPTECSVAALRGLVRRLTTKFGMCCAQVAVRPLEEVCFAHYILLDESDLDTSVRQFGQIIERLVRRTLAR